MYKARYGNSYQSFKRLGGRGDSEDEELKVVLDWTGLCLKPEEYESVKAGHSGKRRPSVYFGGRQRTMT